jgi:predicted nucleic acid-binding protein
VKILLDTSVLVAGIVKAHPRHALAVPWLQQAKGRKFNGVVSAHSIAEVYNVITTLPVRPRIPPDYTQELIKQSVLDVFQVISLAKEDYVAVIDHLVKLGIIGGAIYDALILRAAIKANVDQIVTFNADDFRRVYPALAEKIVTPQP